VIQRISTTVITVDVVDVVSINLAYVHLKFHADLLLPTMQQQCVNVNQLVLICYALKLASFIMYC